MITISTPNQVCAGEQASVQIAPAQPGVSYQLLQLPSLTEVGDPIAGNGQPISLPTGPLTANAAFRIRATNPAQNCTLTLDTTINIGVTPAPPAQVTANTLALCVGDTLAATTSPVPGAAYAWQIIGGSEAVGWSSAEGNDFRLTPDVSLSVSAAVAVGVTVTSAAGCFQADTLAVTLHPAAVADAGVDQLVCPGNSVALGGQAVAGISYQWSPAAGLSDPTAAQPVFLAPDNPTGQPVVYSYQLTAVSAEGCAATDEVTLTVPPDVVADAGPDAVVCAGDTLTLGTPALPGYAYAWPNATGLSDVSAAQPTLAVPADAPADTLLYPLVATRAACSATDTIRIVVNPRPTASIIGSFSVCPNVTEVSYWIEDPQDSSFAWLVDGGTLLDNFGDSITVDWHGTNLDASVRAVPTSAAGCVGDTATFAVRIKVELDTQTPSGADTLCHADRSQQVYSLIGTNGSVYTWGVSGGTLVSGQGSPAVVVDWNAPTGGIWVQEYAETLTDTCYGESDTVAVTVLPPLADSLPIGGSKAICSGEPLLLTVPATTGSIYAWTLTGDTTLSLTSVGEFSAVLTNRSDSVRNYRVTVREISAEGCEGLLFTDSLRVFPEPFVVLPPYEAAVCPQRAAGQTYEAIGLPGAAFFWNVTGGTLTAGQGTTIATIDWDDSPQKDLTVFSEGPGGCPSDTLNFDVFYDAAAPVLHTVGWAGQQNEAIAIRYGLRRAANYVSDSLTLERHADGGWETLRQVATADTVAIDSVSDVATYRYRLRLRNACGGLVVSSEHATILLTARADETADTVGVR